MIWTWALLLGIFNPSKDLSINHKKYNLLSGWIHILPESKMYLQGKTSINKYHCQCLATNPNFEFSLEQKENTCTFKTTHFAINTTNLDCKNSLYNYNIKKKLESNKFPKIQIHLLDIKETGITKFIFPHTWHQLRIKTQVTIRDKALIQNVQAMAFKISEKKYRLKGSHVMSMQDYLIHPSALIFGMIKVEDAIEFNFDLLLEIR